MSRVVRRRADRRSWPGRRIRGVPLAHEGSRTPPRAARRPPNATGLMAGATKSEVPAAPEVAAAAEVTAAAEVAAPATAAEVAAPEVALAALAAIGHRRSPGAAQHRADQQAREQPAAEAAEEPAGERRVRRAGLPVRD